jgi:ribonuclease J
VVGRALSRTIGAARDTGYLADIPDFVSESEVDLIPRNHTVVICTGSQGETRAAMAKIAAGVHESVELQPGDTVIYSSRKIPGNEPAITKVQDMLVRRGIHLITDDDKPVHVSGHPARDDLVEMYGLVRPQIAIPVHGTARHLMAHAKLANNCQVKQTLIPDNGSAIRLTAGKANIIGHAPVGLLMPEGGEVVDLQSDHLRSRRRMLWNGTVTATVVLSAAGELLMAPQVSQTGLCPDQQSVDFIADTGLAIEDMICEQAGPSDDDEAIEQLVRRTVRQMAKGQFKLRPTVHVHVMRTDVTKVLI